MTTAHNNPYVRYAVLSLAALGVIAGGVIAFMASSFTIRTVGVTFVIVGVSLGRFARRNDPTNQIAVRSAASNRPGPILWTVAIVLTLATAISFHYLYQDALQGYQQVLPVYAFAAVGLICGLVWAALLAQAVR